MNRNKSNDNSPNDQRSEDEKIIDYCDCPDRAKCLLKSKKGHIHVIRSRKSVPNVADLDISNVSKELYGN